MSWSVDIREEAGVRTLHFGSEWIQGAMRIARPWDLELDYTREMMASLLLRDEMPRRILLIGLGAASLTKFLYRNLPLAKLTVVEIAPSVVAATRQFFKLPHDPLRLHIHVGCGSEFLMESNKKWDLILVDGYDPDARAGILDTSTFYLMCRAHLSDKGIMAVNLLGRSRGFKASVERIQEAFDGRALCFPSCDSGNAIAFAAAGDRVEIPLTDLKEAARELKDATRLNLLPTLSRVEQAQTCTGAVLKL